MDNDNTLSQMESFDFRGQVKVTITFEDSDEDDGPPSKIIKREISDEYIEEESKTKIVKVVDDNESVIKELETQATRNIITENKTSSEQNVEILKSPEYIQTKNVLNKLDGSDSKKNSVSSLNKDKFCSEISNTDTNNIKCNDAIVIEPEITPVLQEKDDKTSRSNDDLNGQMNSHIKNLFNIVSDHLILIIEAYNHHLRLLYDNRYNQQKVDESLAHWLQLKLHLFNLSYCTVSVLILPELENENFNKELLNHIIQIAKVKKGMNIPYQQISDLYYEMIKWTIGKQTSISKIPKILQATNNFQSRPGYDVLKQHLNKSPMQLNCTKITSGQKDNYNASGALNEQRNNFSNGAPMYTAPPCGRSTIEPPKSYTFVPSQYNHALCERERANSLNPASITATCPAQNNSSNPSMNIESSRTPYTPHNYRHAVSKTKNVVGATNKNLTKSHEVVNKPELKQTCIFSSGPPGSQISINIPHDTLNRNQVHANFNNVGSTSLTAQSRKNYNYSNINNNYVEQGRTQSYGRQPHLYEQRISSSQQMQTNHGNAIFQSTVPPPPPYFTVPGPPAYHPSVQNQIPVFPQQDCNDKQPTQEFQNVQINQQNGLESTRSVSTDSGFTSPLHFSNTTEGTTNAGPHEEQQPFEPLITHVTSLNPNASFINEGRCHLCGKLTTKMCLACFQSYYCSLQCQKEDWSCHQKVCRKS